MVNYEALLRLRKFLYFVHFENKIDSTVSSSVDEVHQIFYSFYFSFEFF